MSDTGVVQMGLFPGFDEPAGGVVKGYVPLIYADETAPEPRSTPDAWLTMLENGWPAIAGELVDDENARPIEGGEVVHFLRLTDHGSAILTIEEDAGYTVTRDMPAGVQVCIDNDPETIAGSVEALVAEFDPEPGEYRLFYYEWSGEIPYRFDAAGKRFVLVDGV